MSSAVDSVPAVELFTTSILSNHKVRHRHERYIAVFAAKKIEYVYHDLASDEDAKKRFRRKALDPQIPNILVHNEWRGTFEEFEESVEFGELDIFLRIDPAKATASASMTLDPATSEKAAATPSPLPNSSSSSITGGSSLVSQKIPPAPTVLPKMAPVGSGAGPKRNSASDFLDAIDFSKLNLTDDDVESLLKEAESSNAKAAHEAAIKAPKAETRYPGESAGVPEVRRTYFPSETAGVKPLRLPKMGGNTSPIASRTSTASSPSTATSSSPRSPTYARYSASQNSTKALAAEALASASNRTISAGQVRAGLDSGKKLQEVLGDASSSSRGVNHSGAHGESLADALFEDLGLGNINMTEEEAEAFLLDGVIPEGLELGGSRIRKSKGKADKARNEQAARDIAAQARGLAVERRASAKAAKERQASLHAVQPPHRSTLGQGSSTEEESELSTEAESIPEISDRTKDLLEKAREKRASRMAGLVPPSLPGESESTDANEKTGPSNVEQLEDKNPTIHEEKEAIALEDPPAAETNAEKDIPTSLDAPATDITSDTPSASPLEVGSVSNIGPPLVAPEMSEAVDEKANAPEEENVESSAHPPDRALSPIADGGSAATPTQHHPELLPALPPKVEETSGKSTTAPSLPVDSQAEIEEEEEDIEVFLAKLQGLGHSIGEDLNEAPEIEIPVSAQHSEPQISTPAAGPVKRSTPERRASRERTASRSSSGSRRAIDVQRKTTYPSAITPSSPSSPSSASGGHALSLAQSLSRSPPILEDSTWSNNQVGSSPSTASSSGHSIGTGTGGGGKSPKLKARLTKMRSFGSMKRSTSNTSNLSSSSNHEHKNIPPASPSSGGGIRIPDLPLTPSTRSAKVAVGNSSSTRKSPLWNPIDPDPDPHPDRDLDLDKAMETGSREDNWRSERTLSQILRDADEALNAADYDEDEDEDDDDLERGGVNAGVDGKSRDDDIDGGKSTSMPDDGLGEIQR